jgi:hypothetical protein
LEAQKNGAEKFPGFSAWLQSYVGGGEMAGSKKDKGNAEMDASIKELGTAGKDAIINATAGNRLLSFLPRYLAPEANMAQDKVDQYNNTYLPGIARSVGDRVPVEVIDKQIQSLKINSAMPPEERKQRVEKAQEWIKTMMNTKIGMRSKTPIATDE